MSYEFKRLGEVEALENVPEGANALIEVDGVIKRAPGAGLGGSGGKALIITSSYFDILASGGSLPEERSSSETFYANMTFNEFKESYWNKEITSMMFYGVADSTYCENIYGIGDASAYADVECYSIECNIGTLYWTAEGFLTSFPGGK